MKNLKGIRNHIPMFFIVVIIGNVGNLSSEEWTFREVGRLIESGNYSEATLKLRDYISTLKDPLQLAEAYYILGYTCYTYLQDYSQALSSYEEAVKRKPAIGTGEDGLEYVRLSEASIGDLYCRLGEYDKAVSAYQKVVSNDPKGIYGQVYASKIQSIKNALWQLKQQQNILKSYSRGEMAANAQFKIAELYRQDLNSPERAISEYEKLLSLYPESERAPESAWRIGNLYSGVLHKHEKAILAYQKVAEKYPMSKLDAEAYFQIGRIYFEKLHRFSEALDIFISMPRLYPAWKPTAVLYWKGACYEKLEEHEEAVSAYKEFVSVYPDGDEPHWLQDIGMFGEKNVKLQMEERIKKLEKAALESYWRKAESLYSKGRYVESLPIYRKLVSIKNSEYAQIAKDKLRSVELLAELQICREKLNQIASPTAAAMLYYRRGEIFETGFKDYNQSIKEYQKVVDLYPKSGIAPKALYQVADLFSQKLNIPHKAESSFKLLIKEYPDSPYSAQANYQLGQLYRKQLKGSRAIESFQSILNYPEISWYVGDGYNDSLSDAADFRIGQTYYYELQDLKSASETFQNFISMRKKSPRLAAAYAFIGIIDEEEKNYESAAKSYQKALNIASQSEVQASMILYEFKNIGLLKDHEDVSQVAKYFNSKLTQLKKR